MSILIITALKSELNADRLPENCTIVYSGVGKINASLATYAAVLAHNPSLVINYGTAGKINSSLNGLYEIESVIQADMCAMPLCPRGVTPFDDTPQELTSHQKGVRCATADSFVTVVDPWLLDKNIDLVEMELFAIAKVSKHLQKPWRAFKFITDDVNDNSHSDWHENVNKGEDLFLKELKSILKSHAQ